MTVALHRGKSHVASSGPVTWTINGRFFAQPITGVQRYGREIVREMDVLLGQEPDLVDVLELRLALPPDARGVPAFDHIAVVKTRTGRGHVWDQVVLPAVSPGGRILSLCNTGPLLALRHIVCIHDLNTFTVPESYAPAFRLLYRLMIPALARRARKVVTVSEFSAQMLDHYGLRSRAGIVVAPNGSDHAGEWHSGAEPAVLPVSPESPYVLMLGSRAPHKNIATILKIAPELDRQEIDVVLVGGGGAIFKSEQTGSGRNVHVLGYVGDDVLTSLFARALCFVFPSVTEGFGLPVLEAMVHRCPVICSQAASLPEVGGDAVLYVAPFDQEGWRDAILRLKTDPALRDRMIAKGVERAKTFTWRSSARSYLEILATIGQKDRAGRAASPYCSTK